MSKFCQARKSRGEPGRKRSDSIIKLLQFKLNFNPQPYFKSFYHHNRQDYCEDKFLLFLSNHPNFLRDPFFGIISYVGSLEQYHVKCYVILVKIIAITRQEPSLTRDLLEISIKKESNKMNPDERMYVNCQLYSLWGHVMVAQTSFENLHYMDSYQHKFWERRCNQLGINTP